MITHQPTDTKTEPKINNFNFCLVVKQLFCDMYL